jgi:hypothetical protein
MVHLKLKFTSFLGHATCCLCHILSLSIQTILMFFLNKMQTFKYLCGHLMVKTENQYSDDLPQAS